MQGQFTESSGAEGVEELLGGGVEFDALIAANDSMALGALEVLGRRGVSVPERVAVCGFDDIADAAQSNPSLSTVRQPLRNLAARGLDIVIDRIGGHEVPPVSSVRVEIIRRDSCGCGATTLADANHPLTLADRATLATWLDDDMSLVVARYSSAG